MDEYSFFPIDQYLMKGGKALFAIDVMNVDIDRNFELEPIKNSPVFSFLDENGIHIEKALLLDENAGSIPVPEKQGDVIIQIQEEYPHWVSVVDKNTSQTNPITVRFQGLDLLWPSPLSISENTELKIQPVLKSSENAWLMRDFFSTNPAEKETFRLQAEHSKGQYVLGVAVGGKLNSYYTGKEIPSRAGVKNSWSEIITESDETRLLVIGDSDFASDLIRYSDSPYNLTFLENAAFWLTNDDDLLGIKTRVVRDLRLNRIDDQYKKSTVILSAELLNIYLIPLFVILSGILHTVFRRDKRKLVRDEPVINNVQGGKS